MKKQSIRTQDELAKLAGVTRVTVNRALSGHSSVTAATRDRVRALARDMGYRPNAMARAMVNRRSHIVGIVMVNTVIPGMELNNQQWFETIMGIDVALRELGYIPALIGVDDLCLPDGTESRALRERLVDGVVVLGNLQPEVDQRLVGAVGTRLVRAEANCWEPVGCIRRDEEAAGRLVAENLLRTDRRPLYWIGNSEPWRIGHFSATERRAGFLAATAEAGEPVCEIVVARQITDDQQRAVRESLKPNVGYACSDSVLVRQLNDIAAPLGYLPGRDFGVACCDDAQMVMQYLPRLARVRFDRLGLGRQAAAMLVERIEDPDAACASRKVVGDFIPGSTL